MTHALALAGLGLRIGRWMVPRVAVICVSGTLAYAVNGAIAGGSSAGDQPRDLRVAISTGEGARPAVEPSTTSRSAESADLGLSVTAQRCAPIGSDGNGSYVDSSIVAKTRNIDCGWAS